MNPLELRAFLTIFSSRRQIMLTLIILALSTSLGAYRLQPQGYQGEVLLSVTRTATENSPDYRYDHFYRLQADERMADSLVRYLESETGKHAVANRAVLGKEEERAWVDSDLSVVRLSSQLIRIRYPARTPTEVTRLATAFSETGARYSASLNEQAKDQNWFAVVESEPVVKDARFTLTFALVLGLLAGIFIAFWTALGLHYWYGSKK